MNIIFISGEVIKDPRYVDTTEIQRMKQKALFVVSSLRQSESVNADKRERYDIFTCVTTTPELSRQLIDQVKEGMSIQIVGSVAQVPKFREGTQQHIESTKSFVIVRNFDVLSIDDREKLLEYQRIMDRREKAREKRMADKAGRELSDSLGDGGYV